MRTLDTLTAWILIALGAAHIALTRRVNPHIDISAIWFASGGLLIIAIGTLNLLRVAYSRVARGIYVVSVVAKHRASAPDAVFCSRASNSKQCAGFAWSHSRGTAHRVLGIPPRGPRPSSSGAEFLDDG